MESLVTTLNNIIWSQAFIAACLLIGLYFSICTRFLQVRHFALMLKLLLRGDSSERGISSFQALSLSLSGRVGVGNIAGVATAIAYGGPGALFWMWAIAFLGASTAYMESVLAQVYKVDDGGQLRGGPAYYIEKGMKQKGFAICFAVATVIATGFLLPGTQSNAIAESLSNAFALPTWSAAIVLVIGLGVIIIGGVKRLGHVAQLVVPFMAIIYVALAVVVSLLHITELPALFVMIVKSAFGLNSALGGIIGSTIAWGVKRGIYSNEAGQGTGAHAAAAAEVNHPAEQGLVQAFSVYIDTLFVCSATGFMILLTGQYNVMETDGAMLLNQIGEVAVGPLYTQRALDTVLSGIGGPLVATSIFFFAFTTLMAYYYIAETNVAYLVSKLGRGEAKRWAIPLLQVALLAMVAIGCLRTSQLAWAMGDLGVGIMAWINLIALIWLRKLGLAILRDYEAQKGQGVQRPKFHPQKLGINPSDTIWK